jgi:hypothetical protein
VFWLYGRKRAGWNPHFETYCYCIILDDEERSIDLNLISYKPHDLLDRDGNPAVIKLDFFAILIARSAYFGSGMTCSQVNVYKTIRFDIS